MRPKPTSRKIASLRRLLRLRAGWKRARRKVVFTNGVYDILHPGHIMLLEKARALGDVLVLGVNSDKSARGLNKKGPRRPVNKLKDRMLVLAALSAVDAVIAFGEDTPARLLSRLKPDIQVKGGDYKPHQVPESVHAGKLVLVPLKKGYSTTKLLRRLK
ncbi:MAG: adenylyltransferase/cytidyltransferase family protein [Elusimicrobiota bacterium]